MFIAMFLVLSLAYYIFIKEWEVIFLYFPSFFQNLKDALKSELTGNFEDVVLASLLEVPEMKASFLRKAMKGAGTDERVLVQVISVASNQEILQLKQAYKDCEFNIISASCAVLHF